MYMGMMLIKVNACLCVAVAVIFREVRTPMLIPEQLVSSPLYPSLH